MDHYSIKYDDGGMKMVYVGIDVAKDKHDCFICNSDGEILYDVFTIPNSMDGFEELMFKIRSVDKSLQNTKAGLEATGHYSCNILGFLKKQGVSVVLFNPLYTSQCRKSMSLRKTKTDKVDARTIAAMVMSDVGSKPYSDALYHNEDLKSLTRYRFDKISERAKLKVSLSRLVNILFPELEGLASSLHCKAIYDVLLEFPSAQKVASANLRHLTCLLEKSSKGRFKRDKAIQIREAAIHSISVPLPAKEIELRHTIRRIRNVSEEIAEIEAEIKTIMDEIASPITTIPGIGYILGAMIIAEIGDFSRFDSPDKILAFAGCSPSTYQSGKLYSNHAKMEKRGSKYLRCALFNAAKSVCFYDATFAAYLEKKRKEGKHYYVAVSHVVKKLIRVIFHLELTGEPFVPNLSP